MPPLPQDMFWQEKMFIRSKNPEITQIFMVLIVLDFILFSSSEVIINDIYGIHGSVRII